MQSVSKNFDSLSDEEFSKYSGKWIAVVEGKVVVSGNSFKEVYFIVKEKFKGKRPLIGKVPIAEYISA